MKKKPLTWEAVAKREADRLREDQAYDEEQAAANGITVEELRAGRERCLRSPEGQAAIRALARLFDSCYRSFKKGGAK